MMTFKIYKHTYQIDDEEPVIKYEIKGYEDDKLKYTISPISEENLKALGERICTLLNK